MLDTSISCHPSLTKSLRLCPNIVYKRPNPVLRASRLQRRHSIDLESAQDGGDALLQVVPSLVAFVDHVFQAACRVGAVLPGQAAVLLVDQFQLGQGLMDLSLETLRPQRGTSDREISGGLSARVSGLHIVMSGRTGSELFPQNGKRQFLTSIYFHLLKSYNRCGLRKGS